MRSLIVSICVLLSFSVFADDKGKHDKHKGHDKLHQDSFVIEVTPLNSPVKSSTANFLIKVPNGFEIDKARYKIKNSVHIFDKSDKHNPLDLTRQGSDYVATVNVSKLPPGQYQFFLKVIDKKTNKEHSCHQRKKHVLKDYTAFIIDESLQVAEPDAKKDKATLEGIDSDNDGLPDRLQRWINMSSYSEDMKQSLKKMGRFMQLVLINYKDPEKSVQAIDSMIETSHCQDTIMGPTVIEFKKASALRDEIRKIMFNTESRILSYRLANTHASGTSSTIPVDQTKEAVCDF